MRFLIRLSVLFFLLTGAHSAFCQDEIPLLGKLYDYWYSPTDFRVSDGRAYVVTDGTGLRVLDISSPDSPVELGYYYTPESRKFTGIDLAGDYAYVIVNNDNFGGGDLFVFDISDPTNMSIVAERDIESRHSKIIIEGDYAFIAEFSAGLRIFNITDPHEPAEVSLTDYPDGSLGGFALGNGLAFVGIGDIGIQPIDISDPENPVLLDTIQTDGYVVTINCEGNRLFVGGEDLLIYDVSERDNFQHVSRFDTPSDITSVSVDGDLAIVMTASDGLIALDVSDPANPQQISRFDADEGRRWDLKKFILVDDMAYSILGRVGFRVYDYSDPENPSRLGAFGPQGPLKSVAIDGAIAYLFDAIRGLITVDVSNLAEPVEVACLAPPEEGWAIAEMVVNGNYLYAIDPDLGLNVFDITDPANVTYLRQVESLAGGGRMVVHDDLLLIANSFRFIDLVDISQPDTPELVGSYDIKLESAGFDVMGDYLYISEEEEGLLIVDISDPTSPGVVKFIPPFDWRAGPFVIDEEARLGAWHSSYTYSTQLFDLSDQLNPEPRGKIDGGWGGLYMEGGILILSNWNGWITAFDVSNPDLPEPAHFGSIKNEMWINDEALVGSNLFVAQANSFLIYDLSNIIVDQRRNPLVMGEHQVTLFPNPVNSTATIGYRLASPGKASVAIYDLRGALVSQIAANRYLPAGEYKTCWDTGMIPAGVYVVRIETSGNTLRKTISVVK